MNKCMVLAASFGTRVPRKVEHYTKIIFETVNIIKDPTTEYRIVWIYSTVVRCQIDFTPRWTKKKTWMMMMMMMPQGRRTWPWRERRRSGCRACADMYIDLRPAWEEPRQGHPCCCDASACGIITRVRTFIKRKRYLNAPAHVPPSRWSGEDTAGPPDTLHWILHPSLFVQLRAHQCVDAISGLGGYTQVQRHRAEWTEKGVIPYKRLT